MLESKTDLMGPPKFVKISKNDKQSINNFNSDLNNINFLNELDRDVSQDPNTNYNKLESIMWKANEKLPTKLTLGGSIFF